MSRLDELYDERARIMREIGDIEAAERDEQNADVIGKCYRYRNCYSCPDGEEDRWWLYAKILRAEDGSLIAFRFETDKYGDIRIQPKHLLMNIGGWEEISASEFSDAWDETMARLEQLS